jgi:hypothetical protein
MFKRFFVVLAAVGLVGLAATPARALTFSASGTNPEGGQALSASADFIISGSELHITLTNTSTADVLAPSDVLTALYFNVAGNPALTRISAMLAGSSTVLFAPVSPVSGTASTTGPDVGGEWLYATGISGPGGANQAIDSNGTSGAPATDRFRTDSNLQGPDQPDGLQYGITSAGDNAATGNAAVTGNNALIQNSVIYKLGNLPGGFALSDISKVSFQYGTSLSEPNLTVAEPGSLLLLGTGLVGLWLMGRRRMKGARRLAS